MPIRKTAKRVTAATRRRQTTVRRDKVGPSGVYPMSGPLPPGNASLVWPGSWGQGKRGAAGYEDHGDSELSLTRVAPEKCRDLMSKDPAFCQARDTVSIAAKLMKTHNIGFIPVVVNLRSCRLVGIVTDRDLAVRVLASGCDPNKTTVSEVMSSPVVTCSPDDDYHVALNLMERHQLKRIVAVDKLGRAVGVISQADVALRIPDQRETTEVFRSIAQPA